MKSQDYKQCGNYIMQHKFSTFSYITFLLGNGSDYSEYGAKAFKAVNTEKGRSMALRAAQSDKTRALASSAVHSEKGRSMALDAIRGDKRRSKDDFDLSSKAVTTKVTRSSSVLNHKSPPTSNQSAKSGKFMNRISMGR